MNMAFKAVDVVGVIGDIVATLDGVFFKHGEGIEVFNRILEEGNAQMQTFPLIYLKQDFKETSNPETETTDVRLNLFILLPTKIDINAEERRNTSFIPILYPIYNDLMNALVANKSIQDENGKKWHSHDKWDRMFWGTESIKGNTPLDVIEIENLELKIINKRC